MNRIIAISFTLVLGIGITVFGLSTAGRAAQDANTLVAAVTQATASFQDVAAAEAAGYVPMFGCVNGPQDGAMGVHFIKGELVGDGELAADQPEALLYEMKDGEWRFLGVEYLVLAEGWEAEHDGPPALMGQLFNYVGSPNRYGNPPFYELHVWSGHDNPHGMFADWNPTVSCEEFSIAE